MALFRNESFCCRFGVSKVSFIYLLVVVVVYMEMWEKATGRELIIRDAHSKIRVWYSNNNAFY